MKKTILMLLLCLAPLSMQAQEPQGKASKVAREQFVATCDSLAAYMAPKAYLTSPLYVERVAVNDKGSSLRIRFCKLLGDYPIREADIEKIYGIVKQNLPSQYKKYKNLKIYTGGALLEDLVTYGPDYGVRSEIARGNAFAPAEHPLVTNLDRPYTPTMGLEGRHIALWQSHGWYYEQKLRRWEWQRARIFETVEDLYTQSYVLPFLVPMLENAGANVLLPRERDVQTMEYVVDNDNPEKDGLYSEKNGKNSWTGTPLNGFANPKEHYLYGENPFTMGTVRAAKCVTEADDASWATWSPAIGRDGEYAVYVSYGTLEKSTPKALYEVRHNGGVTRFAVNQKMGGGTWIYLGTFGFTKGDKEQGVRLCNLSENQNEYVSADAVKFGGGMGNIARCPNETDANDKPVGFIGEPEVSGYPRFTEGSRYWLQWAGMVDTVYSHNQNKNDYTDDYQSRAKWVNAIAGSSNRIPDAPGYGIPVDLSFAFHTDAGTTLDDSTIGTLAIYTLMSNGTDKYAAGGNRQIAREYTDMVQTQIVRDICATFEPQWHRRGLWNSSYYESRVPEVPAMLLELLSHQNLADMRYGLDPSFRFTVSRAIYKGMLKFLAYVNNQDYVVQPLPISGFNAAFDDGKESVVLSWQPVEDRLEKSASAKGYIVYTRVTDIDKAGNISTEPENGEDGFDSGRYVNENKITLPIEKNRIYSFKVTAVNEGGESFPSEILSVGTHGGAQEVVMVVNGFDRVSAPVSFATADTTRGGFLDYIDAGVPYKRDISRIGAMHEYRRNIPWMDDDAPGFGASYADYEDKVTAGNTFDYPLIHGAAIMKAGYDFVSSSSQSIRNGDVRLGDYAIVDYIAGKQLTTMIGRDKRGEEGDFYAKQFRYEVFDAPIREAIATFCNNGGNILVSGANIGTDIWENVFDFVPDSAMVADVINPSKEFAQNVLKYKWMTNYSCRTGAVKGVQNPLGIKNGEYAFYTEPNEAKYCVETPDGIVPACEGAETIFRYSENTISAGVAYKGEYRTVCLGFPIEALKTQKEIDDIIKESLRFLSNR